MLRRAFALSARARSFVQTEITPNPHALKFVPGTQILPPQSPSVQFLASRETVSSPLARKLFAVDGVRSIFYGPDFITVEKQPESHWAHLKPEIFSVIMEYISSGLPILAQVDQPMDTRVEDTDSDVVAMIKELLDTRIRPAIQEDGGDIEYRGFENGYVKLKLRGACRSCESSSVTLRNGIESMLMHYIPDVQGVEQVLDPEEEIALKEFEKFEREKEAKAQAR
ncbi:NifU-like protein [Neolecta irregularis DAH-3]|uniref:NifU-like protein n=1 Tax=Neolecta irregularis (strain DAH-3) TaxID=1198029 RepID=A0A1U7LQQ4_NEOID|nr:NifU-like protein [Neolecta irregularis DAH-3]|eukprot:OLL24987.1 NifU-like protein [Neolecta irregularis DAH-3]